MAIRAGDCAARAHARGAPLRCPAARVGLPHSRRGPVVASASAAPSPAAPPAPQRPEYVPNRISDPNYVRIFDTTLRDGEQSPGATLTAKEKLLIARQLALLGVDIIEAGFPVASPDDFEAVRQIAIEVGNDVQADGYVPVICGLSRTKTGDLDRAWEAVRQARRPRVHTFIATSDIHMKHKLRMSKEQVVEAAVSAVKHLKSLGCNDIEFSPEDAGRSDPEFLYQVRSPAPRPPPAACCAWGRQRHTWLRAGSMPAAGRGLGADRAHTPQRWGMRGRRPRPPTFRPAPAGPPHPTPTRTPPPAPRCWAR
jgi:hypothetical protein